jgi:hypothetical protein
MVATTVRMAGDFVLAAMKSVMNDAALLFRGGRAVFIMLVIHKSRIAAIAA